MVNAKIIRLIGQPHFLDHRHQVKRNMRLTNLIHCSYQILDHLVVIIIEIAECGLKKCHVYICLPPMTGGMVRPLPMTAMTAKAKAPYIPSVLETTPKWGAPEVLDDGEDDR